MAKRVNWRWLILLSWAAVTAVASFYPSDNASIASPVRSNKRTAQAQLPTAFVSTELQATDVVTEEVLDPFAPRGWEPPPPPPPPPVKVAAVVAAPIVPPAPAGPPPLPFKFMGAMNDDGVQVIYLSHGDSALIARVGETLESAYKVLVVDGQHIEFEHLPTGEKQTMTIPASDN
ncbi:MAG TPA: hypothetical protein VNW52_02390 [Burkholderiaceae bacterium]|jgi:hypothetical protein|nr:hypothetical protein [Burkholderiaceae bacterium]